MFSETGASLLPDETTLVPSETNLDHENLDERMFVNENHSHPENRLNVAMFGLLAQDWFRRWVLAELDMPATAIIFPPRNTKAVRPDFAVADPRNGRILGWVEVELGGDDEQLAEYEARFAEPVKAIWGDERERNDLSLQRIRARLEQQLEGSTLPPQARLSVALLRTLISDGLGRASLKLSAVSAGMKEHWLVRALASRLGERLDFSPRPVKRGGLRAGAYGSEGFSLRAFSRHAARREVSLLYLQGGGGEFHMAARAHLQKYLPEHQAAVSLWSEEVRRLGGDPDASGKQHVTVRTDETGFKAHADVVALCLIAMSR